MTDWDLAACQWEDDPEIFWPISWGEACKDEIAEAKRICGGCRIREGCLSDALAKGADGIRGGTTEPERREMARAMGEAAPGPRKECTACGQPLPLAAFSRRRASVDGREARCMACRADHDAQRGISRRQAVNA